MAIARKSRLTQQQFDAIARAVADPRRFAILQQVAACPGRTCSTLEAHDCISPATISHHLKELNEAGLVDIIREGRTAQLTLRRDIWQAYLDRLASL
ncbi:MAG: helix-turn-helix domain-containing protein [Acidobacteriota bacterium]